MSRSTFSSSDFFTLPYLAAATNGRDSVISNLSDPTSLPAAPSPPITLGSPVTGGSPVTSPLRSPAHTATSKDSDLDSTKDRISHETLLFQLLTQKHPERNIDNWKLEVKRLEREKAKLQEITERFTAFEDECQEEGLTPLSLLDDYMKIREENKILMESLTRQQDEIESIENEKRSLKSVIMVLENEIRENHHQSGHK